METCCPRHHSGLSLNPLYPNSSKLVWRGCNEGGGGQEANDPKCSELGWVCIPLAVETYGNRGREAQSTFSHLASHLAIITSSHKSKVLTELYSRLNFTLVRAVARALLARCAPSLGLQDIVWIFLVIMTHVYYLVTTYVLYELLIAVANTIWFGWAHFRGCNWFSIFHVWKESNKTTPNDVCKLFVWIFLLKSSCSLPLQELKS